MKLKVKAVSIDPDSYDKLFKKYPCLGRFNIKKHQISGCMFIDIRSFEELAELNKLVNEELVIDVREGERFVEIYDGYRE